MSGKINVDKIVPPEMFDLPDKCPQCGADAEAFRFVEAVHVPSLKDGFLYTECEQCGWSMRSAMDSDPKEQPK